MEKETLRLEQAVSSLGQEVRGLVRTVTSSLRFEERWRALVVMVTPTLGLGFLALATALTMINTGLTAGEIGDQLARLLSGTLLLGLGIALILIPVSVQTFFVENPKSIISFFDALEASGDSKILDVLEAWAADQGKSGDRIRRHIRLLRWTLQAGVLVLSLGIAGITILVFVAVSLVTAQALPVLHRQLLGVGLASLTLAAMANWLKRRGR